MKNIFNKIFSYIKTHRTRTIIGVIIVLIILFFIRPRAPKPVDTQRVTRQDITQTLSVTGNISSSHIENLTFLTGGKLVYLGVKKGDHINAGDTIGILDQRSVQKNLETALINYSEQRNTFDQTQENNQNRVPDQALNDDMKRILQNNQYDLNKAVISVELQDLAKQQSVLSSPIEGYVVRADADTAGVSVTTATTFTIADLNNLTMDLDVDESDVGKVAVGKAVRVTFDAFPDETVHLTVDRIDYASHTTSTGGTAYTVELRIPTNQKYRIGMGGNADIILDERKDVFTVPISSIVNGNNVYVKTAKGFEKRKVSLGLENDTDVEITKGLSDGEEVAIQPSQIPNK